MFTTISLAALLVSAVSCTASIKKTGLPTAVHYVGCFSEDFSYPKYASDQFLTVEKCIKSCTNAGYRFSAVEVGNFCLCGNQQTATSVDESNCRDPCYGDATEICGGNRNTGERFFISYENNAITSVVKPAPVIDVKPINGPHYVGCYEDSYEALVGFPYTNSESTPKMCKEACRVMNKEYTHYALAFAQCYCGYEPPVKVADELCNTPCVGNAKFLCGGYDETTGVQYDSVYAENGGRGRHGRQ